VSIAEYVMIIHGNEIMEPEELAQLGSVFDETWAAVSGNVGEGSAEQRTSLAIILLRLANLRQLGPEQLKATALRIVQSEPTQAFRPVALPAGPSQSSHTEAAGCSPPAATASPPLSA